MAWHRPGDRRAIYRYRNRNFMSSFREIRIVRYEECSLVEVLWATKQKVTTTLNAAHAVTCRMTVSHHSPSHSDTIFPKEYNLKSFVAVATWLLLSQTLTKNHFYFLIFVGSATFQTSHRFPQSVPPLAVLSHQPLMCSADGRHLHHGHFRTLGTIFWHSVPPHTSNNWC